MTKIVLQRKYVPNPKYWKHGMPNHVFMEPRGSRAHNLWLSKRLFCPMFRYVLVEKGKRHVNSKP